MADFNALKATIDAYIYRNGVQAITGQVLNGVLNGMVDALGKGWTIAGEASPDTDPGAMTGPVAYIAHEAGTYPNFGNLSVGQGEVAMLIFDESTWHKEVIASLAATATIDSNTGTPSVDVSFLDGVLSFDFHNMKGETGEAAGFGYIGATVGTHTGTPIVTVAESGPNTAKNIVFVFDNLKGETGLQGIQGPQGNTGVSADYPITVANNLTTDDPTAALSASQGVILKDLIETRIQDLLGSLAPWAFKGTSDVGNYPTVYSTVFPNGTGTAVLRLGDDPNYVGYIMSPLYNLGENGDAANLLFSCGESIGSGYYPGLVFFDASYNMTTYYLANADPRTVSFSVDANRKNCRLVFKIENVMRSYIYDVAKGEYLFRGADVNLAQTYNAETFQDSIYMLDSWKKNSRGDYLHWNFGASNSAATAQQSRLTQPMFRSVGINATDFDYAISRIVELPAGVASLSLTFSCGRVDNSLMLRLLNPTAGTANYYAANADPRTVTINTNTWTHVQLYFLAADYASCYIHDDTNNEMLWEGAL